MTTKRHFPILVGLACAGTAFAQMDTLNLRIGDAARSEREIIPQLDAILSTATDETLSPQALIEQLSDERLVLIGEEHTGQEFHRVQLRVLELLHAANADLAVGLEMFPIDRQAELDAWILGELDEQAFLDTADWYGTWGYHWGYYRDIFLFSRENAIPMIALRQPADENDRPDATELPVAPPSEDHRTLVQAFFETDSPVHGGLSPEQLDGLVASQSVRDATMASRVISALQAQPGRTLVVLAGTGHVLYDLGIVRHLSRAERDRAASIVPIEIEGEDIVVRASIADYVWGVPAQSYPRYPELGVVTMQADDGLRVIYVESDSPAEAAGVATGDVLTAFNGATLEQRRDLGESLSPLAWGDAATISLVRDGSAQELTVLLRR
ncbi:MAG: PDZ domain-containing protein [Gammaproteobacteria bacterium]|nr:PDZ domain-containing protein [Gammaproteobacteria bacterium]